VSDEEEVIDFIAFVASRSNGHVDVLVNNAATFVFESAEEVSVSGRPQSAGSTRTIF
jgi:NAD(P)-dependent dehydrogenase (short-subunit alcohol dehydrogenase family)